MTVQGNRGYPDLRRRDQGHKVVRQQRELDNRWVVPYNRALLHRYNAHINVEVSTGVKVVKYMFKYVTKGHDRGLIQVGGGGAVPVERDEIQEFVDGRYVSGAEASWRLFHFPLHEQNPSVTRLQVHLEGEHTVVFPADTDDLRAVAEAAADALTTLTAWFALNARNPELARDVVYPDMPKKFVYVDAKREWRPRVRASLFTPIGRMYFVAPTSGEKYYLRLMLSHVPGATCYKDLRTVDDVVYPTFREAAVVRGLLTGDLEWDRSMREASGWAVPSQLRNLFVSILLFCAPDRPEVLWEAYRVSMCEDFLHAARVADPEREHGA